MKFTQKEKKEALKQLREEWDSFRLPKEIDERIFYHYCEDKAPDAIIKSIQEEFGLKNCYAGKCWWYSTNQADFRPVAKRIGMNFNCGACTEDCIPKRFKDKSD